MKKKIEPIIIVEGKYDKIKLESLVDTTVIATQGFGIFKDTDAQRNIKQLASLNGAIILTDSDRAGFIIRKFLHDLLQGYLLYDVYIPDIYGKERRKEAPSAEGKLGVEGMSPKLLDGLLDTFVCPPQKEAPSITVADLYEWGLFGSTNSTEKRRLFQKHLGLPGRLNKNVLLRYLNMMFTKEQCICQLEIIFK